MAKKIAKSNNARSTACAGLIILLLNLPSTGSAQMRIDSGSVKLNIDTVSGRIRKPSGSMVIPALVAGTGYSVFFIATGGSSFYFGSERTEGWFFEYAAKGLVTCSVASLALFLTDHIRSGREMSYGSALGAGLGSMFLMTYALGRTPHVSPGLRFPILLLSTVGFDLLIFELVK